MPPPHAYHVVLGLVIPFLGPADRASLAAVSRECRDLVRLPCPCALVGVRVPPPPGSAPYAWLATHRADTLLISKRSLGVLTGDFLDGLRAVAGALSKHPPRRVEIECPFVLDTRGVCDFVSDLVRAGVAEISVSGLGAPPAQDAAEIRVAATTTSIELALGVDELRLTGDAANLTNLSLAFAQTVRILRVPPLPALRSLVLGPNMRLKDVVQHADDAPQLTRLAIPGMADLAAHPDVHARLTALSIAAPCRLELNTSGVRELEVDMWHRRSDEFAFSTLAAWPRLHTLVLCNVRRLSALDDMVSWGVTGLPPSLRNVRMKVPVEDAIDPPRDIQRYFMQIMAVFRLDGACDLC